MFFLSWLNDPVPVGSTSFHLERMRMKRRSQKVPLVTAEVAEPPSWTIPVRRSGATLFVSEQDFSRSHSKRSINSDENSLL